MQYTPVVIQFIPSVLDADSSPIEEPSEYYIQIKTPMSSRPGVSQALPGRIRLPISQSVPLVLKLLPSDRYFPIGRYEVSYYKKGSRLPLHQEDWVVPTLPLIKTEQLLRPDLTLPFDFYTLISINPPVPYEITHNRIVVGLEDLDQVQASSLLLTYAPAATRDQLLAH